MAVALRSWCRRRASTCRRTRFAWWREAYSFAELHHEGQTRLSGDPYIQHPLQIAIYLAELRQDATTLAAALLHDVVEDCGVQRETLSREFGADVARLVDGVTKLTRIDLLAAGEDGEGASVDRRIDAESVRKMLVAMAEDIRVVLISWGTGCTTCGRCGTCRRTGSGASPRRHWRYTHRWRIGWACGR